MACVRLPGLSRRGAEVALAQLWCRLEEHGLPTPTLDIVPDEGDGDTVHIALRFADPAQAASALHGWAEAVPEQVGDRAPQHGAGAA